MENLGFEVEALIQASMNFLL
ncbi:Protein of unknown function [Bacillus mycoides]|nr:Protein of unknown function [Bacillus mycoides]